MTTISLSSQIHLDDVEFKDIVGEMLGESGKGLGNGHERCL